MACHDFAYLDHDTHEQVVRARGNSLVNKLRTFDPSHKKRITYLFSASSLPVIQDRFTVECTRTLLAYPQTHIIFLVPSRLLVHPSVLKVTNLSRAPGSTISALPCDPDIGDHDDMIASCMTKFYKVKEIDGYMSFDHEENKCRLANIARLVNGR